MSEWNITAVDRKGGQKTHDAILRVGPNKGGHWEIVNGKEEV